MTHPLRVAANCTTHPLHKAQNLMTHPLSAPAHPRLYFLTSPLWTVKKGGFWIRWCHKSYAASITHALWGMLSYFHRFSVFVWTGENDSNAPHVDAFSKIFEYLWMGSNWIIMLVSLLEEPSYSDYLLWHCYIFEICLKRICPLASSDTRFLHRLV